MVLGHDRVELATRDAQSPHHDGNKHDDQGHTDDECDHAVPLSVRAPLPALLYLADRSPAWDVTGSCDRPAGSPDQRLGSNDASVQRNRSVRTSNGRKANSIPSPAIGYSSVS